MQLLNNTLDNLIAIVVILLALSLVVQAMQSAAKKFFKLKSREIERSILHLFQSVLSGPDSVGGTPNVLKRFLNLFQSTRSGPDSVGGTPNAAKLLFDETVEGFKKIGRITPFSNTMLDSVSKADLFHVIGSIELKKIDTTIGTTLDEAATKVTDIQAIISSIQNLCKSLESEMTDEHDRTAISALETALGNIFSPVSPLLKLPSLADADIDTLLRFASDSSLQALGNLEGITGQVRLAAANIQAEKEIAESTRELAGKLVTELTSFSKAVKECRSKITALLGKWQKLESSFDAVMQGFEERYNRNMKTVAMVLSFLVAIFLNANFFALYQSISTSDAKRQLVIESRQHIVEALLSKNGSGSVPSNPTSGQTDDKKTDAEETVSRWLKESKDEIDNNAEVFTSFGFRPLSIDMAGKWVADVVKPSGDGYWDRRQGDIKTLLGWSIMALLLSVGAPFWQDFLESLFGVKNLLRQTSKTRNVEEDPGTGQPKQG